MKRPVDGNLFGEALVEYPLVTVVIVNHNRAGLLQECLASVLSQNYRNLEVLVVDNGSTDSSRSSVRAVDDHRIRLVALDHNTGFAGGCNEGIRRSRGHLIALLNNDAVADPDWIYSLVEAMRSRDRVAMCASKILFHGSEVIDKVGHLMFADGQNRGRGTGEIDRGQYDLPEETFFPDGCAALYRKEAIEEAGGFDEDFFAYGDDADLGVRIRLLGWDCLYAPDAKVIHRHSSTAGRFSPQKVYWVERNRLWLAFKSFPLPLLLLSPLLTIYRWSWNLVGALLGRGPAGNFRRQASFLTLFRTVARALWDGLSGLGGMYRKRRLIRGGRRIRDFEFYRLLYRFRVSARVLSFEDRSTSSQTTGMMEP
jgi:GT2 family glycosyltransferase